jgi:hypothetical protein
MVYFHTKPLILVLLEGLGMEYSLRPFGIFYDNFAFFHWLSVHIFGGHLFYFQVLVCCTKTKYGNPDLFMLSSVTAGRDPTYNIICVCPNSLIT